jgi:hypothetical protein
MSRLTLIRPSDRTVAILIGLAAAAAYVGASGGVLTVYDYYGRLAEAFVQGRYWLDTAPYWLNELLSCGDGRWCVVYPPLPAVLAVPFLAFGTAAAQGLVAQLSGGLSSGVLYLALRAYGAPRAVAVVGAVLSAFGTTLLFSSADGRAWNAAHSVAMLFASGAFLVAARGGSPWILGALIGLAALARLPVAATTPALALLLAQRADRPFPPVLGRVALGGLTFLAIYVGYDILRWGSVFDSGYIRLTVGDTFFDHGLFSLEYLPRNLYAIFIEPPDLVEGVPWLLRPHIVGMSLFLTTPAFLFVFAGLQHARNRAVAAVAAAAGLALLPDVLHATVGFAQFGYRFSLDAQPFLIALAVGGDAMVAGAWRSRPSMLFIVACAIAVAMNVYATIAIIQFGYWQ